MGNYIAIASHSALVTKIQFIVHCAAMPEFHYICCTFALKSWFKIMLQIVFIIRCSKRWFSSCRERERARRKERERESEKERERERAIERDRERKRERDCKRSAPLRRDSALAIENKWSNWMKPLCPRHSGLTVTCRRLKTASFIWSVVQRLGVTYFEQKWSDQPWKHQVFCL
jgi:hypothetical protein